MLRCEAETLTASFPRFGGFTMDRVPMTPGGFQKLEEELRRLKADDRPAIIRSIAEARAHGDLSEPSAAAAVNTNPHQPISR